MSGAKRPAVTLDSQMERILDYPARVALLEEKMKTEVSELTEHRSQLCETLSDWILEDPESAAAADCVNRLWKKCFYERIDQNRKNIAREKKREKDTTKARDYLSAFFKEGIKLMEYLIDRLRAKLENKPSSTKNGAAQCLSRLYICLGDLYRYDQKLERAESSYAMASRLAPGCSHCFNQRAVISDCKESTAVSTYWYLRAIHSDDRPGPAEANLRRLLANNRAWLQQQHQPVADAPILANTATRLFLSKFVELFHAQYLNETIDPKTVLDCINLFQTMLQSSAFSDPLLCKLIAILAAKDVYIYEFGLCLVERVVSTLQNKKASRRGLTPLLLLVEYVLLKPDTTKKGFWQNVVTVWNLVSSQETETDDAYLMEYDLLKGYKPFAPFVGKLMSYYVSDKEAFASFEKAIEESACARIVRFRSLKSALLELDCIVENSDGSIAFQDPAISVAAGLGDENVADDFDESMEYEEGEDEVLANPTPVNPASKARQIMPAAVAPTFLFGMVPPVAQPLAGTTLPLLSGHVASFQAGEQTTPPVLAQAFATSNLPNAIGPPPGFAGVPSKPLFGDLRQSLSPSINSLFQQINTATANPFAVGDLNGNAATSAYLPFAASQTKQSPSGLTKNPFAS